MELLYGAVRLPAYDGARRGQGVRVFVLVVDARAVGCLLDCRGFASVPGVLVVIILVLSCLRRRDRDYVRF